MSQPTQELHRTPAGKHRSISGCCHCGLPCSDDSFSADGRKFCCFGCQTVFSLLHENGLAQFYELNSRPGIRIGAGPSVAKWAFLDDSLVQEKLFDYADKTQGQGHLAFARDPLRCLCLAAGKSFQATRRHRSFATVNFFPPGSRHHICTGQNQIQRACRVIDVYRLRTGTQSWCAGKSEGFSTD